MFQLINVFKKEKDFVKIYRCFQSIEYSRYYVQSVDYFYVPVSHDAVKSSEQQLLELFIEEDIDVRTQSFASLKEAIDNFDCEFIDS
ncbi:MAG: hypothetical protein KGV50_03400 [Gammaproteobacteria bacterium]|nr:hypothetical protein [Gammaproteobacteria bacterium]